MLQEQTTWNSGNTEVGEKGTRHGCHGCRRHPGVGGHNDEISRQGYHFPLGAKHQRGRQSTACCHAMRNPPLCNHDRPSSQHGVHVTSSAGGFYSFHLPRRLTFTNMVFGVGFLSVSTRSRTPCCECERDLSKIRSCSDLRSPQGQVLLPTNLYDRFWRRSRAP